MDRRQTLKKQEKSILWFTADQHFNHANIIKYCNRPFDNVSEMNKALITNWNSVIRKEDRTFVLGDFGFFKTKEEFFDIAGKLNGKIHFLVGSHDAWIHKLFTPSKINGIPIGEEFAKEKFFYWGPMVILKADLARLTLCHYAMRTWPSSHFNSWHLFGHSHGTIEGFGKSFDVGVDCWNFFPISFDLVKEEMAKRPDNFNYVGH